MTELEKLDEAVGIAIEAQMAEDDNAGPDLAKAARIALLSHLAAMGWQVVPKVATPDMNISGSVAWCETLPASETYVDCAYACYVAMIAAAPKFGGSDEG